jgi:hypothetical protein
MILLQGLFKLKQCLTYLTTGIQVDGHHGLVTSRTRSLGESFDFSIVGIAIFHYNEIQDT